MLLRLLLGVIEIRGKGPVRHDTCRQQICVGDDCGLRTRVTGSKVARWDSSRASCARRRDLIRVYGTGGVFRGNGRHVRFVPRPHAAKGVGVQRVFHGLQDVSICFFKSLNEESMAFAFLLRRLCVQGVPERPARDELQGLYAIFVLCLVIRDRFVLLLR